MRKLHQVALVFAAAGGLSAIGAGVGNADAPIGYSGTTGSQPDTPQTTAWSASQATSHASGSQQTGPQQGGAPQQTAPQVNPQLNPQINPQLSPQITPEAAPQASPQGGGLQDQNNLFRPYQECSPQNLLDANLPIALLAAAETRGTTCTQANSQTNSQSNAFAHAR